eukprot:Pgem_evm1s18754
MLFTVITITSLFSGVVLSEKVVLRHYQDKYCRVKKPTSKVKGKEIIPFELNKCVPPQAFHWGDKYRRVTYTIEEDPWSISKETFTIWEHKDDQACPTNSPPPQNQQHHWSFYKQPINQCFFDSKTKEYSMYLRCGKNDNCDYISDDANLQWALKEYKSGKTNTAKCTGGTRKNVVWQNLRKCGKMNAAFVYLKEDVKGYLSSHSYDSMEDCEKGVEPRDITISTTNGKPIWFHEIGYCLRTPHDGGLDSELLTRQNPSPPTLTDSLNQKISENDKAVLSTIDAKEIQTFAQYADLITESNMAFPFGLKITSLAKVEAKNVAKNVAGSTGTAAITVASSLFGSVALLLSIA